MKFTERQLYLYKEIDKILWEKWDPIGVNDYPEARDEYHSYLPQIFKLKLNNASEIEIANYLNNITIDRMGMSGNLAHCKEIARQIIEL